MSCKYGGLIHGRHDAVIYELMTLLAMAKRERDVRAEPLINPGSLASLRSNSDNENGSEDLVLNADRGDIICNGFWGHGNKQTPAIVDVRVTDLDAPSNRIRDDEKVLAKQEKDKKNKYLEPCFNQRRSFTPFVVSTDGLLGREAKSFLKQLSLHLVDKWQKPYSVVAGIVRSRMSIAIIRASHECVRGSRISFRDISKRIQWMDGSGTGNYQISS